nr:3-hydroxy-3-methylglutaryl-ACP synthase [Bacillus pacificus]
FDSPKRLGCFSYGSGCCSEFHSGIVTLRGQEKIKQSRFKEHLDERYELSIEQYENLLSGNGAVSFGTRNAKLDLDLIPEVLSVNKSRGRLVLKEIREYHREYVWL